MHDDDIVRGIAEAMDGFCALGMITPRRTLAVVATAGGGEAGAILGELISSDELSLDDARLPSMRALVTGEMLDIDMTDEVIVRRFGARADAARALHLKNMLFVPFAIDGKIVGAFTTIRLGETAASFSSAELRFVKHLAVHAALAIASRRLADTARRQAERLELLSATTREFATATGNFEALLDLVAMRLGSILGDFCTIRMISSDGAYLEGTSATYHADPELREFARVLLRESPQRVRDGFARDVVESGRSVIVTHLEAEHFVLAFEPRHRALIADLDIGSMLAVPLRAAGIVIGVAVVTRRTDAPPFDTTDQRLLEDLAAHASIAITNARLLSAASAEIEERRRIAEQLKTLSDASKEFAAAIGDPRQLTGKVARMLAETLGDICVLRLVGDDGVTLDTDGAIYHQDARIVEALRAGISIAQRVGDGISGGVIESGEPAMFAAKTPAELAEITDQKYRRHIMHLGITAIMSVPMKARGAVIGVITLARCTDRPNYTDDDLRFAQDLASHATLAVKNTRLLDAVRKTEEQLRQAQKMEAIGRLAGGVAHDFNNLLSVVLSYCTLITEDLPPKDPLIDSIDQIRMAGERAADLTRQLLAFSRQQVIEPVVLDVGETIGKLDKMLQRLVGEDIDVRLQLARDTGKIKADPGHIDQVIMNLVVNARDAMPGGGVLTVETSNVDIDESYARSHLGVATGPHVMIAISDTGSGMDKATMERIFEPFFTTKAKGKGTGLGLSTVFGIIKQSGGSIWVDSEIGKGTTFKVFLRRCDEVNRPARLGTGVIPKLQGTDTILLVEDDAQVRLVARGILKRNGYRLLEARRGAEAIELCRAHRGEIDLLLTDVVMPHMSGRELAEALAPMRPGLKVLYMSGYTEDAILHHRVVAPGIALLQKPLTPDALLKKVRAVLDEGAIGPGIDDSLAAG